MWFLFTILSLSMYLFFTWLTSLSIIFLHLTEYVFFTIMSKWFFFTILSAIFLQNNEGAFELLFSKEDSSFCLNLCVGVIVIFYDSKICILVCLVYLTICLLGHTGVTLLHHSSPRALLWLLHHTEYSSFSPCWV